MSPRSAMDSKQSTAGASHDPSGYNVKGLAQMLELRRGQNAAPAATTTSRSPSRSVSRDSTATRPQMPEKPLSESVLSQTTSNVHGSFSGKIPAHRTMTPNMPRVRWPSMPHLSSDTSKPPFVGRRPSSPSEKPESATLSATTVNMEDDKGQVKRFKFKDPRDLLKNTGKDVLDVAGQLKGDVLDITMSALNIEGLCAACSKIPFRASQEQSLPLTFSNLSRVLENRGQCKFCRLLFQAMSRPVSDPLKHPVIQEYIQQDLRGMSFEQWAYEQTWWKRKLGSGSSWPFGHSRDSAETPPELTASPRPMDDPERRANALAAGAAALGVGGSAAIIGTKDPERARLLGILNGLVPHAALLAAIRSLPLPVYIVFALDNGLIDVEVLAFGRCGERGHRTALSSISHFKLRMGSPIPEANDAADLKYGLAVKRDEINFSVMREALKVCEDYHGDQCNSPYWSCRAKQEDLRDFRVIDVDKQEIVPGNSRETPYACLSYIWGPGVNLSLSQLNRDKLLAPGGLRKSMSRVPQTICDAMLAAQRMGIRYLWVDSLCIVQDDAGIRDRHMEQMNHIYGNALLTIVAADSEDAYAGIAGVRTSKPRSVHQIVEEVQPGINVLVPLFYHPSLLPWDSRAWTFQEKLLSRRLLVFNHGQVRFHCRHSTCHEDMSAQEAGYASPSMRWVTLPEDGLSLKTLTLNKITLEYNGNRRLMRSPLFAEYAQLVEDYSRRPMTKSDDALRAVRGLLNILPLSGTEFGLPDEFLDLALLWQPAAGPDIKLQRRKTKERFPSWSWAAWEAVIKHVPNCNMSDCANTCVQYKGGVRYERPFRVLTNGAGSLRKGLVDIDDAEERMRPTVHWHRWPKAPRRPPKPSSLRVNANSTNEANIGRVSVNRSSAPVPINGSGLGLALDPSKMLEDWSREYVPLEPKDYGKCQPQDHYLVFRSHLARFRLGETKARWQKFWRGDIFDHEELYHETSIVSSEGQTVGRVILPDPDQSPSVGADFDFVAISEAQYFGDEQSVSSQAYPLLNVMMLAWDEQHTVASRLALGRVYLQRWLQAKPKEKVVILG